MGPAPTLRSPLNLPLNHLMARTSPPRHSLGHSGVPPPLSLPPLSRLDCTESFLPTPSEQLIGLRHPLPWPCPACSDPRPSHRAVCRVGQLEYVRSAPTWVRRPPRAISNTLATTTRRFLAVPGALGVDSVLELSAPLQASAPTGPMCEAEATRPACHRSGRSGIFS